MNAYEVLGGMFTLIGLAAGVLVSIMLGYGLLGIVAMSAAASVGGALLGIVVAYLTINLARRSPPL